jgi:hypothetical protein
MMLPGVEKQLRRKLRKRSTKGSRFAFIAADTG